MKVEKIDMKTKNIVQGGVAKSGNYWLWKIIDLLVETRGEQASKYINKKYVAEKLVDLELSHENQSEIDVIDVDALGVYWRVGPFMKERICDTGDYLSKAEHVWTHSKYSNRMDQILVDVEKIVYIIRHPISVAFSQANFAFTPYVSNGMTHRELNPQAYFDNRLEWIVRSWVENVSSWLGGAPPNTHIIFYENLSSNFDKEFNRLIEYLELEISEADKQYIKKKVSKGEMSKNNKHHVRIGDKVIHITEKQKRLVSKLAGPLLREIGYSGSPGSFDHSDGMLQGKKKIFLSISRRAKLSLFVHLRGMITLSLSRRPLSDKIRTAKRKIISWL